MAIDVSKIKGFEWDEGNINKNYKKHGVHFKEAEEALLNEPLIVDKDVKHSSVEQRYHALGQTDQGVFLFISFTVRENQIRVISARKQSKRERKEYEKHQKS